MSRTRQIIWDKTNNQELARAVKNYSAKVKRLIEKDPQKYKYTLPQFYDSKTDSFSYTITVRQMKELIKTKRDLTREVNALKRFTKRGAEELVNVPNNKYNLKITQWQKDEMLRRRKNINSRRKTRLDQIESLEASQGGKGLGYTLNQFGLDSEEKDSLVPIKAFTRGMSRNSINWKFKGMMSESQLEYFAEKDKALKDNYLKGILTHYNANQTEDIRDAIENMDIKAFLKKFYAEGGTFEIPSPDAKLNLKSEDYKNFETVLRTTWVKNRSDINKLKNNSIKAGEEIYLYSDGRRIANFDSIRVAKEFVKENRIKNLTYNIF